MIIKVFSRQEVEAYKTGEKTILISIRDAGSKKANIQKGWQKIMFLDFDDIDRQIGDYRLFTLDDANKICGFVEKSVRVLGKDIIVVINCEAGISRSAAVGLFLERVYNNKDRHKQYPLANKKVYTTLLNRYWNRCEGEYGK